MRRWNNTPILISWNIQTTVLKLNTGLPVLNANAVKAFPNPFSQSTTISFPNPSGEPYRMVLMDISGKVMRMEENITEEMFIMKRDELEKGMYVIELSGSKTHRGKLVIR